MFNKYSTYYTSKVRYGAFFSFKTGSKLITWDTTRIQKEIFRNLTSNVTMTSLLKSVGKF